MARFANQRRPAIASDAVLVTAAPLSGESPVPICMRATVDGVDLLAWAANNRAEIERQLADVGAILFRGFAVDNAETVHAFIALTSEGPLTYRERSSPRHEVGDRIYTSTDHPPDQPIFLHNEHSYATEFPCRLYFACLRPADTGGETPLADSRAIFQRIDPAVREEFRVRGYQYIRNFGDGVGLPWQTVFGTDDRALVERYCLTHDIEAEWKTGNRLRTRQMRRLFAAHPTTDALVWFNHATFFHVSTLPDRVRDALLATFALDDLPNHTRYGDGAEIEPDVLDHLKSAYRSEQVEFAWERGDLLMLDNMLVAHARNAYKGERRVIAGMANLTRWADLR